MIPGLHDLPLTAYERDPCPEPSLSSSIIKLLFDRSPAHARLAHPRLNGDWKPDYDDKFDLGTAAHALLVGAGRMTAVLDFADYKTKAAREARDQARIEGKTPLLAHQHETARAMVGVARFALAQSPLRHAFTPDLGLAERTLIWQEGETWCRARPDWITPDAKPIMIVDYKTTSASANPEVAARWLYDQGGDIQAAWYRRGVRAALGDGAARFIFVCQENEPPYALSLIELGPHAMDLAEDKIDDALALWRRCLREGRWPGYPSAIACLDAPVYAEKRQIERRARNELAAADGRDLFREAVDFQSPLTRIDTDTGRAHFVPPGTPKEQAP